MNDLIQNSSYEKSINFLQSILTNFKKVIFIINNNTLKLYRKILYKFI